MRERLRRVDDSLFVSPYVVCLPVCWSRYLSGCVPEGLQGIQERRVAERREPRDHVDEGVRRRSSSRSSSSSSSCSFQASPFVGILRRSVEEMESLGCLPRIASGFECFGHGRVRGVNRSC